MTHLSFKFKRLTIDQRQKANPSDSHVFLRVVLIPHCGVSSFLLAQHIWQKMICCFVTCLHPHFHTNTFCSNASLLLPAAAAREIFNMCKSQSGWQDVKEHNTTQHNTADSVCVLLSVYRIHLMRRWTLDVQDTRFYADSSLQIQSLAIC